MKIYDHTEEDLLKRFHECLSGCITEGIRTTFHQPVTRCGLLTRCLDYLRTADEQSCLLRMLFCQACHTPASNLSLEGFGAQTDGG